MYRTAGVIGAGAWGTALALVCARAGLDVILQAREPEVVESVTNRRVNEAFLPGVVLDDRISVTFPQQTLHLFSRKSGKTLKQTSATTENGNGRELHGQAQLKRVGLRG